MNRRLSELPYGRAIWAICPAGEIVPDGAQGVCEGNALARRKAIFPKMCACPSACAGMTTIEEGRGSYSSACSVIVSAE